MKINIIAVGKIKEKFLKEGIEEFKKRISKFADINIIEIPDESIPDNCSNLEILKIKNKESQKIQFKIKDREYTIALALDGHMLNSIEFAKKIENTTINGTSTINFIIGGSLGLSDEIIENSDYSLSFSKMTFPHKLMRLILIEQIYRAFSIINNITYHK